MEQNKVNGEEERTLGLEIKIALPLKQTWGIREKSIQTLQ